MQRSMHLVVIVDRDELARAWMIAAGHQNVRLTGYGFGLTERGSHDFANSVLVNPRLLLLLRCATSVMHLVLCSVKRNFI